MSGKRLLDVAALFEASRQVASKALALRASKLQDYGKTSSLARALQAQAGQNRTKGHSATKSGSPDVFQFSSRGPSKKVPSQDPSISLEGQRTQGLQTPSQIEGIEQDHFYVKSKNNSSYDPLSADVLNVRQKKASEYPLPDGSLAGTAEFASSDSKQLNHEDSQHARELQRRAERQVPSESAEPPPDFASGVSGQEKPGFTVGQEQDVFFNRPRTSGPVLSALPRVKVPKHTGSSQGSLDSSGKVELNPDVFHSTVAEASYTENTTSGPAGATIDRDLPEETYAQLFQSPRTASKLRPSPKPATKDTGDIGQSMSSTKSEEETIRDLASDLEADKNQKEPIEPKQSQEVKGTLETTYRLRESRVPSSRLGRLWQYGGLATSMAFGAVGEGFRRAAGSPNSQGSLMLSASNMERLVAKLSKMRGAALKIGQMLSFQDSKTLPAPIHEVLRRVQDSADYMPPSQRNKVLADNLGSEWRKLFSSFDETPIAAASIGQVHKAKLESSGKEVAVKIQYPGVASSIDSDLSNLAILLTASKLLPKGLYLDKTIANARTELAWECDYVREAEMGNRFRALLADETATFTVPAVFKEASGPQVLTAEFCGGTGVTKLQNFTQEEKDRIGTNILRLCLREIMEFKFMQTDPNWTNFLFNSATGKLELLDFGAAREYPDEFILPYIQTLIAASRSDRAGVRDRSIQLGYLTGHESQAMLNAHIDTVLTLAEPFADTAPEVYDFQGQTITDRVRSQIPVMLRERLSPPPEETYSLHRKLSGAFLLCAKLGSRVRCRDLFANAIAKAGLT